MYPELINDTQRLRANLPALALTFAGVAACIAPSQALAEWNGGISGGAVIRDGEQSNRLRLTLTNETRPLSHNIYADYIFGGDQEDAFELGYRPRYYFNEKLYVLAELNYRVDEQIGIDQETGQTLGVGYQFLQDDRRTAYVEVSAGARQVTFTNNAIEDLNEPFGRARVGYSQLLGESARFQLAAASTVSDEYTETSAEVGITVNIATFALTLGYRIINQSVDGLDSETDDTTTFSFNYAL